MRHWKWIVLPVLFAGLAGWATHLAVENYVLNHAAQNIRDVLLSHRGVHLYIQRTMHPEFYRARDAGEIPMNYYAPEILSSSFMVRVLHGYYNEERVKEGLPPIYYKMASDNPRNPINKADKEELHLLEYFRGHPRVKEVREVKDIKGQRYLVVAMPFLRTDKACIVCHGKREDAPIGLQVRYPGQGGFNEKVGSLRAIESLRVPLKNEEYITWVSTVAALVGFGVMALLLVFNRSLNTAVREKTAELSSQEHTSRTLLESADAVPFEYSITEDRYTFVGEQSRQVLGLEPDKLRTSADWEALIHPDDRHSKLKECQEAITHRADHECRLRLVRPDGTSVVIHQTMKMVREKDSVPLAVGFMHDITSDARNDAIQNARLAIAEKATSVGFDELIRSLLDEAEILTESEISFFHFVHEDQQHLILQEWSTNTRKMCAIRNSGTHYPLEKAGIWADCVRTGEAVIHNDYASMANKNDLPDGHVPLSRELVLPLSHGGKVVAVIGVGNKKIPYDMTDVYVLERFTQYALEIILRKRAEAENTSIQAQLLQSQKMESIGRLAGGVAHDFNNMLSVILGHSDLLLNQLPTDDPLHEDISEIREAAERSAAITRQLLAFARQQVASPRVLDLNEAIDSILKMLRRLIGEDIDLVWRPQSGLRKVFIDPSQIDQVLANLATNARDAISGVGKLTIETQNVDFDDEYCRIHAGSTPGRYVLLGVSDSGKGIAREDLGRVFEPFFTTKNPGEGTGLGLAMVMGIVKQNGGSINIYSEPGQGTTFKIYLPECVAKVDQPAEVPQVERDLTGTETILLVEDEAAILQMEVKILQDLGYTVFETRNPAEAITFATQFHGRIDLLITDVVMPGMNGQQLAQSLSDARPDLKHLFVSGYTSNVIVHRGILADGIQFIAKPFSVNDFARKTREVLDS